MVADIAVVGGNQPLSSAPKVTSSNYLQWTPQDQTHDQYKLDPHRQEPWLWLKARNDQTNQTLSLSLPLSISKLHEPGQ